MRTILQQTTKETARAGGEPHTHRAGPSLFARLTTPVTSHTLNTNATPPHKPRQPVSFHTQYHIAQLRGRSAITQYERERDRLSLHLHLRSRASVPRTAAPSPTSPPPHYPQHRAEANHSRPERPPRPLTGLPPRACTNQSRQSARAPAGSSLRATGCAAAASRARPRSPCCPPPSPHEPPSQPPASCPAYHCRNSPWRGA